jgi:cold shock CspA family protein
MRTHGTLTKWNDDRGFGFITAANSSKEIFVHVSAFPRDALRPRVGEMVSFEIEASGDGRQRAIQVFRPGEKAARNRTRDSNAPRSGRNPFAWIPGLLAAAAIGAFGYSKLMPQQATYQPDRPAPNQQAAYQPDGPAPNQHAAPEQQFHCDGRTYCSQMTSCAEAIYFLRHCPGAQMDGNHDGEPCEQQWCN